MSVVTAIIATVVVWLGMTGRLGFAAGERSRQLQIDSQSITDIQNQIKNLYETREIALKAAQAAVVMEHEKWRSDHERLSERLRLMEVQMAGIHERNRLDDVRGRRGYDNPGSSNA